MPNAEEIVILVLFCPYLEILSGDHLRCWTRPVRLFLFDYLLLLGSDHLGLLLHRDVLRLGSVKKNDLLGQPTVFDSQPFFEVDHT